VNRSVVSWALYDIANTAFNLGVVGLFLPLWIDHTQGTTDADLGIPISISMGIVLVLSPFIGAITDQLKSPVKTLTLLNIAAVIATFLIGFNTNITTGLIFFCIAFVFVYLAEVVYNTMLKSASTPENRGRIGGIAIALGYIGSLGVVALALYYQGINTNYAFGFQAIAVLFFFMALPISLFFVDQQSPPTQSVRSTLNSSWKQIVSTRRFLTEHPRISRFLLARYFYMISVTTGSTFGVLYGLKTIGFTETQVELVLLVGVIASMPSAIAWGYLVDRIGPLVTLRWNLVGWVFVFGASVSIPWFNLDNQLWWGLGVVTGACFGGLWVADRPLLIKLAPTNLGEMFGIYGTVSRLAFLTGSAVWSLIVVSMGFGQPTAVFILMCCCATGLILLIRLRIP